MSGYQSETTACPSIYQAAERHRESDDRAMVAEAEAEADAGETGGGGADGRGGRNRRSGENGHYRSLQFFLNRTLNNIINYFFSSPKYMYFRI